MPHGHPWAEAPPVRISPQLAPHRQLRAARQAQPGRWTASSERRRLQRARDAGGAETAAARARLRTDGPILLSELGVLDPRVPLFLALLGDALAAGYRATPVKVGRRRATARWRSG